MKNLNKLQQAFQNYILQNHQTIVAEVADEAQERLQIYQHAYQLRCLETLMKDFPILWRLLGEVDFFKMVLAYITAHPSAYRSLRDLGCNLPNFLKNYYINKPWLAELALVEWKLIEAFDAADEPVMTIENLAAIPADNWPNLNVQFISSFIILPIHYDLLPLWQAVEMNQTIKEEPQALLIWRKNYQPQLRYSQPYEESALTCITQKNFAAVCGLLQQSMPVEEVPLLAVSLLKTWFTQGLVTGINSDK